MPGKKQALTEDLPSSILEARPVRRLWFLWVAQEVLCSLNGFDTFIDLSRVDLDSCSAENFCERTASSTSERF
jgi:hypothetical protein